MVLFQFSSVRNSYSADVVNKLIKEWGSERNMRFGLLGLLCGFLDGSASLYLAECLLPAI